MSDAKGCAHVSLLSTWMPDEATATAFADSLREGLSRLKRISEVSHFTGKGQANEDIKEDDYAW